MNSTRKTVPAYFGWLAAACMTFLAACSSTEESLDDLAFKDEPADRLYNEGLAALNSGDVSTAQKKFKDLDRQHPYSTWAKKSLVLSTYTNFQNARYDDAISSARRFITLYPGDEDAAYVQYLIGQSYFRQIPDVTRDQEMTAKALRAMRELVQRYPESDYTDDARQKVRVTLDQLAGKEMQVGRYYQERQEYIAAANRFKTVVSEYQTTRHVEEALLRLTETYLALGVVPEAQTAAAVLGHNFPDSEWYQRAYELLAEGGYKPQENKGSWISKTVGTLTGLS
ncbi:outer membrane protein assembly factor BamD [Coralliovum pocilloporae]|uniref:outer membrane protein assembly factor BamD n=1 Tax=Coralliovum pocilloporae TaxID=3066369 RepID=UPI003307023C